MPKDTKARVYLGLQIVLLLYLIASGAIFVHDLPLLLTQIFAVLLIIWALLSLRMNKHAHAHPKGYFLVTHGAYEIIRHPIYAGILLFGAASVQEGLNLLRFLAFIVLVIVTIMKLTYEENIMEHRNKDYGHYKSKTNRIIPYFY